MYIKLSDQQLVIFDVDETIISHFPRPNSRSWEYFNNKVKHTVWAMEDNIKLLYELRACDYQVAVWSLSGSLHAERMVKLLGLEDVVDLIIPKPKLYVDDKLLEEQPIPRVWKP